MLFANMLGPLFAQDGPPGPPPMWTLPLGPTLGIIFGVVVLGLLLWGLKNPQVWVIVAVLGIGIGIGAAVYGITVYSSLVNPMPPQTVERASLSIGGGVGGAVGGFILLIVAVLRMRMNADKKA